MVKHFVDPLENELGEKVYLEGHTRHTKDENGESVEQKFETVNNNLTTLGTKVNDHLDNNYKLLAATLRLTNTTPQDDLASIPDATRYFGYIDGIGFAEGLKESSGGYRSSWQQYTEPASNKIYRRYALSPTEWSTFDTFAFSSEFNKHIEVTMLGQGVQNAMNTDITFSNLTSIGNATFATLTANKVTLKKGKYLAVLNVAFTPNVTGIRRIALPGALQTTNASSSGLTALVTTSIFTIDTDDKVMGAEIFQNSGDTLIVDSAAVKIYRLGDYV